METVTKDQILKIQWGRAYIHVPVNDEKAISFLRDVLEFMLKRIKEGSLHAEVSDHV